MVYIVFPPLKLHLSLNRIFHGAAPHQGVAVPRPSRRLDLKPIAQPVEIHAGNLPDRGGALLKHPALSAEGYRLWAQALEAPPFMGESSHLIRRSENNVRLMGQMRNWDSADPDAPSGPRDRPELWEDKGA